VPYELSFNLAMTILHIRANTNLLCSKQLRWGDLSMSIWEKLAGAATGMVRSGPIGAFLGGNKEQEGPAEDQVAFTVGVIVLGAKMAKADGVVTDDEVNAFKEVFKIPAGEMKNVAQIFNMAKQDATGYEAYAEQLASMLKGNRRLLEDVLEGLFHIAKADNVLHPREVEFLGQVAKLFGITETEFGYIKVRHVIVTKRNPYDVLGVTPSINNDELKSHYRKLVEENHPDKLMARGVPKEFVAIATEKVAAINGAYGEIATVRGI
jgi:DnaJ like chaperone protein